MSSVEKRLCEAAKNSRVEEVLSLLRDHPDLDVNCGTEINAALHFACFNGCVEMVQALLAHTGINVNIQSLGGQTPLSFACECDLVSVVQLLLKDPRVDVTLGDKRDCTPLWRASYRGHIGVVEWLIASGRDLGDVENRKGKDWGDVELTAPEAARERKRTEVASLLERFMANPAQTRLQIRQRLAVQGIYCFFVSFVDLSSSIS